MKVIITESQYNFLIDFINEVISNPMIFKLQHGENGFEQYLKK